LYTPARPAPDEDFLGRQSGYPVGTAQNYFFDESVRVGSFRQMDAQSLWQGLIASFLAMTAPTLR
jgi:hypothetical protein